MCWVVNTLALLPAEAYHSKGQGFSRDGGSMLDAEVQIKEKTDML